MENFNNRGHPTMYNACPSHCGGIFTFEEAYGPYDYKHQNAVDNGSVLTDPQDRYCLWTYTAPTYAGCMKLRANEQMTFQIGIKLGPRITSGGHYWWSNSRIEMWMQYEGAPSGS